MTEMTIEQARGYFENGGNRCPFCLSDNIAANGKDFDGDWISASVHCYDCDEDWIDIYRLVGVASDQAEFSRESVLRGGKELGELHVDSQ